MKWFKVETAPEEIGLILYLPKAKKHKIVYGTKHRSGWPTDEGYYTYTYFRTQHGKRINGVTHWQPLPDAPTHQPL